MKAVLGQSRKKFSNGLLSRTIVIANQKGGVGKTATCQNLSFALMEKGLRVLAVDFDPQMNLTTSFIISKDNLPAYTIYDLMALELSDQRLPPQEQSITPFGGLDILAGSKELGRLEKILLTEMGAEGMLRSILTPLRPCYDYVIIDTNRAASPLMTNALMAADSVLIPVTPEFYATEGLTDIITTVLKSRRRLNPSIQFEGIVFTISDSRTNLYKSARAEVESVFQGDIPIFRTFIPRTVHVGEAIKRGLSVIQYDPASPASTAYQALAEEVIEHARSESSAGPAPVYNEGTRRAG